MSRAAVILAAGAGSRFGTPGEKLLADSHDHPLLTHALAPAEKAAVGELVVVSGAADLGAVVPASATLLLNTDWNLGQATSLRVAIDWCQRQGHDSVVVGLGDMVGVTAEAWQAVAEATGGPVVVATYLGRRGYPVRLDSPVWASLPIDGDDAIGALIARQPTLVTEVACSGKPIDVDTKEDLLRWN